MTGRAIADATLKEIVELQLDLKEMVGISSDGGSNVSGKNAGAQALIRAAAPQAVFVHCAAHNLNLTVGDIVNLPDLRNCVAILKQITKFIRKSAKRSATFADAVAQLQVI